jgi:hypothetical protein
MFVAQVGDCTVEDGDVVGDEPDLHPPPVAVAIEGAL